MDTTLEALLIGPTMIVALLIFANFNGANVRANRWFGFFILCVFIIQVSGLLYDGHYFKNCSHVYDFIDLANFVVAPVFYFSITYFIEPERKWRVTDNLHFLFAFVLLLLTILVIFINPQPAQSKEDMKIESTAVLVFMILFCIQVLPYCIVAYYKLNRYQRNLFLYSSNVEKINLNWLKKIVVCVFLITVLWLTDGLFQISVTSVVFDTFSNFFYFVCICYIAYHALKQREIFPFNQKEILEIEEIIEEIETEEDVKRKLITDEKLAEYRQKLAALMDTEKPHQDYEISLIKLAALFNVSPHQLSYIINKGFNENFFQFINRYRIEEAKKMILDPQMNHLTFIGIAFEVGFNSKTVFNTTFKKITGTTPSDFKKNHNQLI